MSINVLIIIIPFKFGKAMAGTRARMMTILDDEQKKKYEAIKSTPEQGGPGGPQKQSNSLLSIVHITATKKQLLLSILAGWLLLNFS